MQFIGINRIPKQFIRNSERITGPTFAYYYVSVTFKGIFGHL